MQINKRYPIKVEHWVHLPYDKFMGLLSDNGYNYIFGITPEDPNDKQCCYFNIWIEKKIVNETTKTVVFYAKTYSGFKVRNKFQKPTPELFFELIENATQDFALQFHYRTQNTNLSHHKIRKPQFGELRGDIEKTIDIWDKTIKNRVFETPPNWQTNFRDLPEIPEPKKWVKGSYTTPEQDISFKLLNKQPITQEEEKIFIALTSYYNELDEKLKTLNYQTFSEEDFENFKNYIFYAFNYLALVSNKLTVFQTYRLIVNEWVTGKNEPITDINFLKYPSLDKVKELNKYNRANTPLTNSFYSAENIDTALKEIRPPTNKLVTVGVWKPKDINKKLLGFPILHSDEAFKVNQGVQKATKAFEEHSNYNSSLFMNYMRYYFKVLGREYTKKVSHHYEYLISALFSERIFAQHEKESNDFKYDCIVYPSVGNDYITENLAILPNTLDNDFKLTKVIEFEVDEAYYDRKYVLQHPEVITLAKIKNYRATIQILDTGEIKW